MNDTMTKALGNWRDFNEVLVTIPEKEVMEMLEHELQHENRKSFVERLHQRYNTLRVSREREEIMGKF
jgi:hypothetical protein